MSFLSSKMTHTNEGLCHPDKAQEDGDSGQGLASVVQRRKGVVYVLCFKSGMPWRFILGLTAPT